MAADSSLCLSSKIVVISAKKIRKKGKAAPDRMAETDPRARYILSDGVIYEKREKKGAEGIFLISPASSGLVEIISSSVKRVSLILELDSRCIPNIFKFQ